MAKPIFVMRLPKIYFGNNEQYDEYREQTRKSLPDYHVLFLLENIDKPKFECFNADNMKPVTIGVIRKIKAK